MRADFRGRVVAITGGAGGIGRALAAAYAKAGARVALLDIDPDALRAASDVLDGVEFTAVCDVTDPASCQAAVDAVVAQFGRLDVLVNNAGISHRSTFDSTDPVVLRRVMEVNFFGSVNCTRAALSHIVARRGWIVALSSVAGFAPLVGRTGYCASKHALHGFFDSLRAELAGTGVTVLLACPYFTDTAMRTAALDGDGAPLGNRTAARGVPLSPDDVAESIVNACERRQRVVVLGRVARLSWWISRIFPRVYERLMLRSQREEFG